MKKLELPFDRHSQLFLLLHRPPEPRLVTSGCEYQERLSGLNRDVSADNDR